TRPFSASGQKSATDPIDYIARARYEPHPSLQLALESDKASHRGRANWRVSSGKSLYSAWNSASGIAYGGGISGRLAKDYRYGADVGMDGEKKLHWSVNTGIRKGPVEFQHRATETGGTTSLELPLPKLGSLYDKTRLPRPKLGSWYNKARLPLSKLGLFDDKARSIALTYDRQKDTEPVMGLTWTDLSIGNSADRTSLWQYQLGIQQKGLFARLSVRSLPGIELNAGIRKTAEDVSFNLNLSLDLYTHPRISPGSNQAQRLRNEGGLFVQPFFDENGNGELDRGEGIHTEDIDTLLMLDNKAIGESGYFKPTTGKNGAFFRVAPSTYRLDVDPAAAPIGWKAAGVTRAVEISAGGFTRMRIPLLRSYIVVGVVTDAAGNPAEGTTVEASLAPSEDGVERKEISVSNRVGIFYMEDLQQGQYAVTLNGEPASTFTLDENSDSMVELNLQLEGVIRDGVIEKEMGNEIEE
ncbi:MAG: carboxypeptidase regulatory-like domain-containing protein, partial [Gammaproteobacteria bacterium]|nr:carboxypeptidase regulatory-like domain-containing protein [Gammaproteobacteria bacterium]